MPPAPTLPHRPPRLSDEEKLARAEAFLAQMRGRRSVRHFSERPLPPGLMERLVEAAGTAPSGANLQPWRFVAVTDPERRREIREAAEAEERAFYEGRAPPEWLADLEPLGTDWRKPFLETAPGLIAVFRQSFGAGPGGERRKHYYSAESVGIAVGFLLCAVHQAGLVALTHTPSPMNFLERILGRPEGERAYLLIPIGEPADDAEVPDIARKPLQEILSWA